MVIRVLDLVGRVLRVAPVVTLLFGWSAAGTPVYAQGEGGSAPAAPAGASAPAAAASPAAATAAVTPSPAGSPTTGPNAEATASARRAAEAACKKTVATFKSGDLAALKSLSPEQRAAVDKDRGVLGLVACLAAADGNSHACSALPKTDAEDCAKNLQLLQALKAPAKGGAPPAQLLTATHQQCRQKFSAAECDKMQEAWTTRDASKCKGLPKELSDGCVAVATGDASRCPKESNSDCRIMIKVGKEGLAALPKKDPGIKAFMTGKREECAPLLAALQERCSAETPQTETPPQKEGEGKPAPAQPKEPHPAAPGGN